MKEYTGGHPTHKWQQDNDGITSCDNCDTYPYYADAKLACEWIPLTHLRNQQ